MKDKEWLNGFLWGMLGATVIVTILILLDVLHIGLGFTHTVPL